MGGEVCASCPVGFPRAEAAADPCRPLPGETRVQVQKCLPHFSSRGNAMGPMHRWEQLDQVHGDENKQF